MLALAAAARAQPVTLADVHGLTYSGDGRQLMVAHHHGIAIYEAGKWSKSPAVPHDYMGFSATRDRFYSSGHPAQGSGEVNPLGLIRSEDGGKNWRKLGLERESDFHLMGVGWNTNAIYVWNAAPNSRMKRRGLHYTLNDGLAWRPAEAAGLSGDPRALAVHPDNPAVVAVATSKGVFLSRDSGASFKPRAERIDSYAVFIDLDGKRLWYGAFDDGARLAHTALGGGMTRQVELPPLGKDAVAYIAQNPAAPKEYAIATFSRSLYLTKDGGASWTQIAERGQSR